MWWRRRRRALKGLDEDIRDHIARETEEGIARGMTPEEAHRQALVTFGNVSLAGEDTRAVWLGVWLDEVRRDAMYATRTLCRNPGFTAAVVLTLCLGIGVNTAIFSMVDAVILQKLPVPDADDLVGLHENAPQAVSDTVGGMGRYLRFSYPRFVRLQQALGERGSLAAMTTMTTPFSGQLQDGRPTSLAVQLVSGNYFETLRVLPARGRMLTASDSLDTRGALVAVVSDAFWRREMGGAKGAVGQQLTVNGITVSVVGVAPEEFTGVWMDDRPDVWLPLTLQSAIQYQNNVSSYGAVDRDQSFLEQDRIAWLNLVGRIPRAHRPLAETLLQTANQQGLSEFAVAATTDPRGRNAILAQTLAIEPLAHGFSRLRARQSSLLLTLMGFVGLILILTAANLANLLLVRAGRRGREIAVRVALGATKSRIVRLLLAETFLLAGIGGLFGVLAAGWSRGLLAREIVGTPRLLPGGFSLDARTLFFAAVVSLLTALVFGLVPAVRAARGGRLTELGLNERQAAGIRSMRGMRPLVVLQLALSVIFVFAATLLSRTLVNLVHVEPGFAVEHLVSASFNVRPLGYSANQLAALEDRLVSAAEGVPGATSAAVSVCGLLARCSYTTSVRIDGVEGTVGVYQNWVGPRYFSTVGLPLLRGREFDERDTAENPRVAVITDSVARRYFPGQDPLGKRLAAPAPGQREDAEIVGVVGDLRPVSLRDAPVSMVFYPLTRRRADALPSALDLLVSADPNHIAATVREALQRAQPGLAFDVIPMPARLDQHLERERAVAGLASAFAGLALLLASVGLFGLLAYSVAQRRREIGIRMALGAQRAEVLALVLKQGAALASLGLVLGLLAAPLAARSLQGMLYEVAPLDPATFVSVAAILLVVTALAVVVPARRATRIDPAITMRSE
jgi:predicted permease